MYCQNLFCVYYEDEKCTLDEITLDIHDGCQECIYVSIEDEMLKRERQKILSMLRRKVLHFI